MDDYTRGQLDFYEELTVARHGEKDPVKAAMLLYGVIIKKGKFLMETFKEDQRQRAKSA